jgi:outer membrane protein
LNVQANISTVVAFKQALKSSRTALKATEAGYEVGTRTAVDVLNSRQDVYRAERDYARSRYTYLLETLKLKKAAGILTEQDVVAINQLTTNSEPIP